VGATATCVVIIVNFHILLMILEHSGVFCPPRRCLSANCARQHVVMSPFCGTVFALLLVTGISHAYPSYYAASTLRTGDPLFRCSAPSLTVDGPMCWHRHTHAEVIRPSFVQCPALWPTRAERPDHESGCRGVDRCAWISWPVRLR
jgi:hypothetical protein